MKPRVLMLSLTTLGALSIAGSARAQSGADGRADDAPARHASGATVSQSAKTQPDSSVIEVTGHSDPDGLMPATDAAHGVSAVTQEYLTLQAPTLNAFQMVALLPGANVSSSDPYGLSTSSGITLRGLGQDEIGVLMEGAPQNDIGYYYAYPAQFADTENLRSVSLSAGSVDLNAPVVNGAGGMISVTLKDPEKAMGGLIDASLGSYGERRIFARFDTGSIGHTGLRAFVSYSDTRADNWRGAGVDKRRHIDFKLLDEWGGGNRAALAVSFNEADSSVYPGPSLDDWKAYGIHQGYDANYDAKNGGNLNYWRLYRAPFRNLYFSAPVHIALSGTLTFDSTSYLQFGYGNSPYGTQLSETGNYLGTQALAPITLANSVDGTANVLGNYTGKQRRAGEVASLSLATGAHTITAGLWFDYGTDRVLQTYTALRADGTPVAIWGHARDAIHTATGELLAYENIKTTTVTKGFFLADTVALNSALTLDVGFKGVDFLRHGYNYLPGPQGTVRAESFAALPRAALRWRIGRHDQLFANVSTHFRAPDEFSLYDTYDGGQVSSRGVSDLKNEYAISQELGWRHARGDVSVTVTGFHYHFRNRQISTVIDNDGALLYATVNAGGQTSWGIDAEADWQAGDAVSLYASGEWLRAKIDDDLPVGDDLLPTRGKDAVASPHYQVGFGARYDDSVLFGTLGVKYVAAQYSTFMNDERIPGFANVDVGVGVHLGGFIDDKRTDLRINAMNLFNARALSGVMSISTNARDTAGRDGTLIEGSAPYYYIASGRAVMVTLSRGF